MTIRPIGEIRNRIEQPMREGWEKIVSELVLRPELAEAVEGLEQFSHIIVVFWMHKIYRKQDIPTKVHPMRSQELPLLGLFATRSPHRPNPLGVTIARLLERKANILKVTGLDAINGTPVIDIKPYLPGDSIADIRVPDWVKRP